MSIIAGTAIFGTGTVYIRQDSVNIQFQVGSTSGDWTTINGWPVFIGNSDTAILRKVLFYTDITLTGGANRYFICGSDNIQFGSEVLGVGGTRPTITIDNIADYPGLIQNGDAGSNGQDDIYVVNLKVLATGTTTLASEAGWVGQKLFSKASTSTIVNCHSDGAITTESGGIVGMDSASRSGADLKIIGCTSSGAISGDDAGGICGASSVSIGTISIFYCSSSGEITGFGAGGIAGQGQGQGLAKEIGGTANISGCYSTGSIGIYCGGICGQFSRNSIIANSYSRGIIDLGAGGICGAAADDTIITNSYSSGIISTGGGAGGIFGNTPAAGAIATNYYFANGSWSDSAANAALQPITGYWESTGLNTPMKL